MNRPIDATAGRWAERPNKPLFHVFPEGRMCSLRRALLLWIIPLFLVVGGVTASLACWSYTRMERAFMDTQMEQLGQSLAGQAVAFNPPTTSADRIHHWGDYVVQVYDKDGALRHSTWPALRAQPLTTPGLTDVKVGGDDWRVYVAPPGSEGRRVQVYQSAAFRSYLAFERTLIAIAPVAVLLPLAILALWMVAGAMSRAVQRIGREAAGQDEHTIAELQLEHVPQEIKPLVQSFNSLLTRLRDAFATQRRFVQDAAHELRTPITAVALQLENVKRGLPAEARDANFAQLEAGIARAQRMVDQMLKLSRQEGAPAEAARTVNLHDQVAESINALIALADLRGIDLGLAPDSAGVAATLHCPSADLRSLLDNLIENALRYTPEGGVVDVRVEEKDGRAAIEVIDTGPGIPAEMMHRVFDRFFRVPGSAVRGSGLGLAIAQAAAQRCGLKVTLKNRSDRSGLVARVEML